MKLKSYFSVLLFLLIAKFGFSQSTNCSTATPMALVNGAVCVNGTSTGAITDNTLYGGCNSVPVNMVWYTYVTTGTTNVFTVTPGTLTNAEIVIYLGGCPTSGGVLQLCNTAVGSAPVTSTWGIGVGTQVWIGVASNAGNDGTFQLCVTATNPPPTGGQLCSNPILLCNENTYNQASMSQYGSSGQTPNCFANPTQQDMFLQFTVLQSGTLAWTAMGLNPATEYDWCLWNVTAGCPGTEVCCNYNFGGGSSLGFGMQNSAGNVACGYNLATGIPQQEFSPTVNVVAGQTYQIQISNYDTDNSGFNFNWTNSTCVISPNANFTINPNTVTCGPSVNVTITNTSLGGPQVWDYGDGSPTYTGTNPAPHTYSTPGTYAITCNIGGPCPSTHTEYVNLYAPLAATSIHTNATCSACNGTADVNSVTGGNGVYTYSWAPGGQTTPSISGLCPGTYIATISNAACGTSVQQTVTITTTPPVAASITASSNIACFGGNSGSATCTPSSGISPFTFSWSPLGGTGATANNLTAGPYVCTVTDSAGCTNTASVTLTQPTQLVLDPDSTITSCSQANGSATCTPSGGTGPYDFVWTDASNTVLQTANNLPGGNTLNNIANGTYNVLVTDANNCLANIAIVVTGPPGNLTDVMSSVPVTCFGSCDGTATATLNGGTTPYTYLWSANAGSQTTPTATNLCIGTYTVNYHDVNNCVGSDTIVVSGPTAVTASAIAVPSTICIGQSSTLTATPGGGSGAGYTYVWSPAGTGATQSVSVSPTVTTIYTVVITDSNGCTSPPATVTVTVNPALDVTLAGVPTVVCLGSPATMNVTSSGGNGGPYTYTWLPAGTAGNTTSATVTPTVTTTYTVILTDGCTNPPDSAFLTVTVNQPPIPAFIGNPLSGCAPVCTSFMTPNNPTWTTCAWNFGDGNTTTGNCNPQHCYTVPGCYDVTLTVTDANGCSGSITMPNYVCVYENVVAAFTAGPQPTDIFNTEITFVDQSSGNPNSWIWDFGTGDSSYVENPVYSYPNNGEGCYTATLIANNVNNCPDTAMQQICIDPDYVIYFPNAFTPNGDGINDYFVGVGEGIQKYEMWIFDRWGNMIYYTDDINKPWDGKVKGKSDNIVQEDVYVWKAKVTDVFDKKHKFIGHVSVIK